MRRGTLLTLLFATLPVSAEPKPEKFIETYCLKCHDSVSKKGGADFGDLAALPGNFDSWVRLFDRVEKKEMPPAGSRAPGEAERTAFLKSLRENLHTVSRAAQEREGRTKTGDYDCSNILDDVRHPRLGFQLTQFWDFRNGT